MARQFRKRTPRLRGAILVHYDDSNYRSVAEPRINSELVYHRHMKKIVITGGHHNSALVVAEELRRRGVEVVWIGQRQAAVGDTSNSAEYREVTAAGFPFLELSSSKLSHYGAGFFRAWELIKTLHPDAALSFGGYLGAVVAVAAWARHIPVYLHEQTIIAGKANVFAARFARRIYLTWPASQAFFPRGKSLVVGMPMRPSFLGKVAKASSTRPRLFVLGGKQGSHVINEFFFNHLAALLAEYDVVHQTGTSSATGDYARALALKKSLPAVLTRHYHPHDYLGEKEIAQAMQQASVVVGRSGAHTVYELGVLGVRAVLIPYHFTNGVEQEKNAAYLVQAGNAVILSQNTLSLVSLSASLSAVLRLSPHPLPLPTDATTRLVADLLGR